MRSRGGRRRDTAIRRRLTLAALALGLALGLALPAAAGAVASPAISGSDGTLWTDAPEYTITASNPSEIVRWGASNGQNGTGVGSVTVRLNSPLTQGSGSLTADATDEFGNDPSPAVTRTFRVDSVAPSVTGVVVPEPTTFGWNKGQVTVNWLAADPAPSSGDATVPPSVQVKAEGVRTVTSGQSCDPAGNCARGKQTVRIDKGDPTISAAVRLGGSVSPPNGTDGWYKRSGTATVSVRFTCADAVSGIATCPADVKVGNTAGRTVSGTAADRADRTASTSVSLKVDQALPTGGNPSRPTKGAKVGNRLPTFTWTPGSDATSGLARYEVWVSGISTPVATAKAGTVTATATVPLPDMSTVTWWVRTIDRAGNETDTPKSGRFALSVDTTAPASPKITGGPEGPTQVNVPTFAWAGPGPTFSWTLTQEGIADPVQSGSTGAGQVTLAALGEGRYIFGVAQTNALGVAGVESTRAFEVDRTPPAPPALTTVPPTPSTSATPTFAWTPDPLVVSTWAVLNAAGVVLQGPVDTIASQAIVGPLAPGSYVFRVSHRDAAGNESPAVTSPFTIATGAATTSRSSGLPAVRAKLLRPAPGTRVRSLRPILRWRKGPRGTTLYNVQIFRVVRLGRSAGSTTPRLGLRKAKSVFPRARRYRVASKVLVAGGCYVWRVWPYMGTHYSKRPLAVSNFCVSASLKRGRQRT